MAGASMQPIYERLNAVAGYNPLTADTFGDWAMEAGDIVKVVRGTEEYNVPVHSSTLVWRGKQRISIDATGKKERDSIAKASARKFRGGAAVRSQQGLYQHFESEDLSIRSEFAIGYESLRVAFENEITSTRSEFRMTSESLRIAFENEISSTRSEFYMTSESLRIEFENEINSTRSEFQMTSESLRIEFENEISSTRSEFRMTSESLRIEFENEINSTRSEFQMTSESLRIEFESEITSTRADIQVQSDRIGLVVSGTGANARIRPAQIVASINNSSSEVLISADKVKISGTTTINDVFTVADGHVATKVSMYAMPGTVFNGDHVGSFYYSQQEGGYSVQYGTLKKAEVDGNTLKIWKFGDTEASPSITFSKATTLTGAVGSGTDGNKYTVTASPQGVTHPVTVSIEIEGAANPNATVYAKSYVVSPSVSKTQIGSAVEMTLGESTSGKYVELYTGSGTSKIQKGKISTEATYNSGWNTCRGAMVIPTAAIGAITSASINIGKPKTNGNSSVDNTTYTMSVNSSFTPSGSTSTIYAAELKTGSNVVARIDINSVYVTGYRTGSYAVGWSTGWSTTPAAAASFTGGDNNTLTVATTGRVNSSGTSANHSGTWKIYVTSGNNTAYARLASTSGNVIAKIDHNKYNLGWDYGQTQIVRTTRAATSQETTVKTLDYSERFAIVDTYTKSNSTTSTIKYIVEAKADRYDDGRAAVTLNNPTWTHALPYTSGTSNTATVSTSGRPTQLSKTVPVTLSEGQWSNGSKTVDITTTNGSVAARITISAPSATLSYGNWAGGKVTVTAKHGTKELGSTTVSIPSVTSVTMGSKTTGNTYNCSVAIGDTTKASTINATTAVNDGKAAGWSEYYNAGSSYWAKSWECNNASKGTVGKHYTTIPTSAYKSDYECYTCIEDEATAIGYKKVSYSASIAYRGMTYDSGTGVYTFTWNTTNTSGHNPLGSMTAGSSYTLHR